MKFKGGYLTVPVVFLVAVLFSYQVMLPTVCYAAAASEDRDTLIKGASVAILVFIIARIGKSFLSSSKTLDGLLPSKGRNYPDTDLDWLAHIIYSEARGEPLEGQIAVGAVVLNRMRDSRFPNTIREIILAENQFTAVEDGQFFLTPNEAAYKAAQRALAGEDPTGGALYFYNPAKARNLKWFQSLTMLITIGNHVFLID